MSRRIACLNDVSDHGGIITDINNDGTFLVCNAPVAVQGALHSCPVPGHGVTSVTAVVTKSFHNNKLILTQGAVAGCGAKITPVDRGVYVNE